MAVRTEVLAREEPRDPKSTASPTLLKESSVPANNETGLSRSAVTRDLALRSEVGQSLGAPDSDAATLNLLTPLLYEQLRRVARRHLVGERSGHTFNTTDLINEAYLKLAHLQEPEWKNGIHFLSVASRAMRMVLVDYARRRRCAKRGADPV